MARIVTLQGRPGRYIRWRDARGKRRQKRVHGTKVEIAQLKRDLEQQLNLQRLGMLEAPRDDGPTLEELTRDWRTYVQARRQPRTWQCYALALRDVLSFLSREGNDLEQPEDLTMEGVERYVAWKLEQGVSASTVNLRVRALRAMFNWAVKRGHIPRSPLARWEPVKGPTARVRQALGEFQIAALLRHSPPELADVWRFLLGTGLRGGELASLEWNDVDWKRRRIHIRKETSKSKKDRRIPLRDDLVEVLHRQRSRRVERDAVDSPLVFTNTKGGHWRDNLSRKLKPCLEAAGLSREIDVHCLRHTFGTHLAAHIGHETDGKTVQRLLGHSSALVTLDIYSHALPERERGAVDLVPLPPAAPARKRRAEGG